MKHSHRRVVEDRLQKTELFAGLSRRQLRTVAENITDVSLPAGRVLLREGTPGRQMIVIQSGQAVVTANGGPVAILGPGSHAGEIALLSRGRCIATVTAMTEVSLLVVNPRELRVLMDEIPVVRRRLAATVATRAQFERPEPVDAEDGVAVQ